MSGENLEDLIAEATLRTITPVTDHPKPCIHTLEQVPVEQRTKCPTCLWFFCVDCASTLDPQYCRLCLSEQATELRSTPLVDDDGVQHEGRVLTPAPTAGFFQPRFGTLAKTISEMSDNELEAYVQHYKDLVHQAEVALDFRRVVLGSSQLESSQRKDAAARKLRADRTKYPVRTVTVDKATGKQKTVTASAASLTQMMQALEALRKLKDQQVAKKKADDAAKAVDKKMGEPHL